MSQEYCLGSGDLLSFRVWTAQLPNIMQGLQNSTTLPPATVADFLAAARFNGPRDEENIGSGFSPLMVSRDM